MQLAGLFVLTPNCPQGPGSPEEREPTSGGARETEELSLVLGRVGLHGNAGRAGLSGSGASSAAHLPAAFLSVP